MQEVNSSGSTRGFRDIGHLGKTLKGFGEKLMAYGIFRSNKMRYREEKSLIFAVGIDGLRDI